MAVSRRVLVWSGVLAGGGLLVALGVVFVVVGLDDADKISSTLGAFIGLAGLALSGYGVVLAQRIPAQQPQPDPEPVTEPEAQAEPDGPPPGGSQVVSGKVDGDNIQIGHAGRDVNIDRRND